MKRKSITIALALLLVAGMAFAGMGRMNNQAGSMQRGQNIQDCQLLTEEEQIKVHDAKFDFEKKAIPLRAEIRILRMEMNELILNGKSSKEISGKLSKLNDTRSALAAAKLAQQIEVRNIVGEDNYRKMGMYNRSMMQGGRKGHYKQGSNMMGGRGYNNSSPYWNIPRNVK
ncbi:MAG: hypothetical protein DRP93_01730 [Candidatus Neomarinimicrobiota bacterium]|nr:MAG: hypothetical protein DRP93_01730 [Candidatus Neomarinimicrobiota bacterium]